ncbi:MAG: type II toxin-antitoxin system RelE/ParE family toxin [Saprospiraceae bacterium]|nr:type II toxin-antitoxin system RelE/ParE family toxin [Bacteroidia bacterium]NNE15340.1 type II toxin-antitoxin system RelE/ParE family toxin [Saprospiraceae bacterium]NNL91422.1 type II toxin-antitoxin system RelE/ParE family toxin [Saprospiraceae bacterium]
MSKKVRSVQLYKNYFKDFYRTLDKKSRTKVDWTIQLIEYQQFVPIEYFKKLSGTNDIWEIRVKLSSNAFRIFCFFDGGKLIILENGFRKKSQKTPKKEIEKAERIKKQYFNEKE